MQDGINKPFDRILKAFADEAPGLLLHLLGLIPPDDELDIQHLRPETAPPVVFPDYVAVVRGGTDTPVIFHVEFQSNYQQEVLRDMARYGGSLAWQYQVPVTSVLVMLRPDRAPAEIPEEGEYRIGRTRTTHPFKVVRLWEVDPAPVLDTHNPRLLPWALLMNSTDVQVREIASILASEEDEDALARFLALGIVRYDRNALEAMVGEGKMGFVRACLDASPIVQEERDLAAAAGEARGKAEGNAEGKAAEARSFLRLLLRKCLPELESLPEIDAISNPETLEAIAESVLDAATADSVRSAILAAANPS